MFTPEIISLSEKTISKPYILDLASTKLSISRILYKHLGSVMRCSAVVYREKPNSFYQEFLNDMQYLDNIINGDPETRLSAEDETALRELDKYLGGLGITEKYPISRDRFNLDVELKFGPIS